MPLPQLFQAHGVFQTLSCLQRKRTRVSQTTLVVRFTRKSQKFLSLMSQVVRWHIPAPSF
jgi:hypothetical protein